MGFSYLGASMMTAKIWNELGDKLTRETSLAQKENIICDALIDGKITVDQYKILIEQICTPIKSVVTTLRTCDCGAKHTSFPNHHYHWCGSK